MFKVDPLEDCACLPLDSLEGVVQPVLGAAAHALNKRLQLRRLRCGHVEEHLAGHWVHDRLVLGALDPLAVHKVEALAWVLAADFVRVHCGPRGQAGHGTQRAASAADACGRGQHARRKRLAPHTHWLLGAVGFCEWATKCNWRLSSRCLWDRRRFVYGYLF